MTTCKRCGWEVKLDFGQWIDVQGFNECGKNATHTPNRGN
jgi:hypothetical protein